MRLQTRHSIRKLHLLHLSNDEFRMSTSYIGNIERMATMYQQLIFLKRCRKMVLFPAFINKLRLPSFIMSECNSMFLLRLRKSILSKSIRFTYDNIKKAKQTINLMQAQLQNNTAWSSLRQIGNESYNSCKKKHKSRLIKKFNWLQRRNQDPPTLTDTDSSTQNSLNSEYKVSIFHQFLDSEITERQLHILDKGPKFNLTNKMNESTEVSILKGVIDFTHQLKWRISSSTGSNDQLFIPFDQFPSTAPTNPTIDDQIRIINYKVNRLIKSEKKNSTAKQQFSSSDNRLLKEMKNDENIYLPSDKGGDFAIIGRTKYVELGESHLQDSNVYKRLTRDKTESVKSKLNSIWRNICTKQRITRQTQLKLTTQTCRSQKFYHLLKTHKAGLKIRPIISGRGGPFDRLGWLLQKIITPLLHYVPSHLYNTGQLLDSLNQLPQDQRVQTKPISLDVVSMYTNIPIDEGIQITIENLSTYSCNLYGLTLDDIQQLMCFILKNNVFTFNNNYYQQIKGLAMGSRIAPTIAIVTMDKLERQTLHAHTFFTNHLFKRYVDDCLLLINKNDNSQEILTAFNSAHATIKFEIEDPDEENSLNILDVNIKISDDGTVTTKFYEKAAKSDIFINAFSAVSIQTKKSAIQAEINRIDKVCSTEIGREAGQKQFINKLKRNGYSASQITKFSSYSPRESQDHQQTTNRPIYIPIPFISDTFQRKIKHILSEASNNYNIPIRISNRSNNTLRANLSKISHKSSCNKQRCLLNDPKMCCESYIVYYAKCQKCDNRMDYVGSSKQYLHDRVQQHYTKSGEAIYQHNTSHSHNYPSFKYKILSKCYNLKEMLITEAIYIKKIKPTLNRRHEMEDVLHLTN